MSGWGEVVQLVGGELFVMPSGIYKGGSGSVSGWGEMVQ